MIAFSTIKGQYPLVTPFLYFFFSDSRTRQTR